MTELITVVQPPKSLVQQAMEMDWDLDRLKQIIELQVAQEKRSAEAEFNAAFNAAQAEIPTVVKDKKNTQKNTMYASLDAVNYAVTPVATKHRFSTSCSEIPMTSDMIVAEGCRRFVLRITHIGGHFREFFGDFPMDGKGAKDNDVMNKIQGFMSTTSYARRCLICLAWNIAPADTDRDGERNDVPISTDEIGSLNGMIETIRLKSIPFDLGRFLVNFGCKDDDDLSAIRSSQFVKAVGLLNGKIQKGK
jgi:hypothetical protein